ncbi:MBL fold metallo-hydrolase [Gallibacterium anatis]|uniref:Metallo-beta-lactamase domain-containing protein n=1 Tax=Gallibacterium anatis TaxID=750 RepID=A0A0A2XFJ9_9PAST|nr:MBL fold metallo-hydrolase [Gallibacterium anatis]KGQ29772.1 hypothetical protein JP32_10250 [Gallibacterium anatis]
MKKALFTSAMLATIVSANVSANINYQHIRNATAKIDIAGTTFLVDPYLAPKGSYAGFEGTVNSEKRNPLIELSMPVNKVLQGVDAVIVTHTHDDHWDKVAQQLLPKNLPIFVQNASDAKIIRGQGFKDVRVVGKNTTFNKVRLSKTGGQHGTDEMYSVPQLAELAGEAMGVVMQAEGEKTLYLIGDTIWNYEVDHALDTYKPDLVVMNTGYAQLTGFKNSIIMGTADVAKAYKKAPNAQLITVHMDAVNHTTISSDQMRKFVKQEKMTDRVNVPKEGQTLSFK